LVRDLMLRFRSGDLTAAQAAEELKIGRRRFYQLYLAFLKAVGRRQADRWSPGTSGGDHRHPWPEGCQALLEKLLRAKVSYSAAASEVLRLLHHRIDRATVRRFALAHGLAPARTRPARQPVRRWQTQKVGQLWQYDASPHRWLPDQDWQPTLLNLLDDHSRWNVEARLFERETLLAHLDFLGRALQLNGLPLALYVDYHSFFFTHTPEAHTQLAAALHFHGVSLRFAPTPQAKGKIERSHQVWQKRLPPLLQANGIADLPAANALLDQLRRHRNDMEKHRELGSTPKAAWNLAKKEKRWALRPAPPCPWWPYVFSQQTRLTVGDDGKVAIGSQRLSLDAAPRAKVMRCLHPNGDITVLKSPPDKKVMPVVLLSTRLC
jgi:hypothetical protein